MFPNYLSYEVISNRKMLFNDLFLFILSMTDIYYEFTECFINYFICLSFLSLRERSHLHSRLINDSILHVSNISLCDLLF